MKQTFALGPLLATLLLALSGCDGGARPDPPGRYQVNGRFTTTLEVAASSPECGPLVGEKELTGSLAVGRAERARRFIYLEGPGCTVEASEVGPRVYVGDGKECVLDPKGAYVTLGIARAFYRSFRLDLSALTWSYEVDLTWPSTLFPEGTAKVCGKGTAKLTREPADPA